MDLSVLAKKKVFEETKWLFYCLCQGYGIQFDISPLVAADNKMLCCHSQAGTQAFVDEQGACAQMGTCICLSEHCALPPAKDTPKIVCCNQKLGDKAKRTTGTVLNTELFQIGPFFDDAFWCYYCFCCGRAVHAPKANSKKLYAQQQKFLCCAGASLLESPSVEGIWCSKTSKFLCCVDECAIPPAASNPKCGICTWTLNKDFSKASDVAPGRPQELDM